MNELLHEYFNYWEEGSVKVIECLTCGFKHLDPIPSDTQLEQFYQKEYFHSANSFNYDKVTQDYIRDLVDQLPQNNGYNTIFSKVNEIFNTLQITPTKSMLDVGGGNDLLSKFFQLKEWDSYAIEPSITASKYLEDFEVKVFHSFINGELDLPLANLSFVNMQHVLEHIRSPLEVLGNLTSYMQPSGIIRIVVPNDFSDIQFAYKDYYKEKMHWIKYPDHINYFTYESLSELLLRCGLKEIYRTTTYPVDFFLLGGVNYYSDKAEQQKVGPFINNFEQSFINTGRIANLEKWYESLAQIGFGRSIVMYAVKS